MFQGSEFNAFLKAMRETFTEVLSRKPKASRDRSSEITCWAKIGADRLRFRVYNEKALFLMRFFCQETARLYFGRPGHSKESALNNIGKNIAIWVIIGLVLMTVFNQFSKRQETQNQVEYSTFIGDVEAGRVQSVVIEGHPLRGQWLKGPPR